MKIKFRKEAKKYFPCYSIEEMLALELEVTEIIKHPTLGLLYKTTSGRCIPEELLVVIEE